MCFVFLSNSLQLSFLFCPAVFCISFFPFSSVIFCLTELLAPVVPLWRILSALLPDPSASVHSQENQCDQVVYTVTKTARVGCTDQKPVWSGSTAKNSVITLHSAYKNILTVLELNFFVRIFEV